MKIALLSPIAWRTPPRHYGPWEQVVSNICEGLVANGIEATLFATGDSITAGKLEYISGKSYEEDKSIIPAVWSSLHIGNIFEQADRFDIIHNNFDFTPLTYSQLVKTPVLTTIHGFSSSGILPVYRKYNKKTYYVSISNSDRSPDLDYIGTVYNGIDMNQFTLAEAHGNYLLFFGRIHHDKGASEAIEIAKRFGMKLILSGIIQDQDYFDNKVLPYIDDKEVIYAGHSDPLDRDRLLGGAYALLHPINFDEPFGLSVAESMACGTPVVAFNRGSMPELIRDKETGFLVSDIDEALRALKDIPTINRKRCREWVKMSFSKEKMVEGYIAVYNKILSS